MVDSNDSGPPLAASSSTLRVAEAEENSRFSPMLRGAARFAPEAADRPILVFEDVYKAYRAGAPVLRGVNLAIERGEFVFVTGPSGAGKSTLLQLVFAAERADSEARF